MHGVDEFLHDLAIIMLIAGATTVLFSRMRQPVVLGYILAGLIIGPHTPPYNLITNEQTIHTLSEMGVIFLMFSLGLEFSLKKLRAVGATALCAAVMEIVFMIWIGFEIGRYFDWKPMDSLFLGAMLAVSSTTIIVKALSELNLKQERFAQMIFGTLIVEDILAIGLIALLSGVATTGEFSAELAATTIIRLGIFLVVSLTLGILLIPRLLEYIASFHNDEMLLVSVLGICFGFCLVVIKMEYSVALGAFVIGAIMAESRQLYRIEHLVAPIRDMFSAVFFVAVGLMLNPTVLQTYALPILIITLATIFGKIISCGTGAFLAGQSGRTSMRIGMGLAQIGEFSFIIAMLGVTYKVTSDFLYPIAVAVSAITTLTTPYLIKAADPVSRKLADALPTSITSMADMYTRRIGELSSPGENAFLAQQIKRSLGQILINLCLIAGMFITLGALYEKGKPAFMPDILGNRTLVWALALLLSLPFFVACYRKLKALGQIFAEATIGQTDSRYPRKVRQIISELVPIFGTAVMLSMVFTLSGSMLPPVGTLWLIVGGAALTAILMSRQLIRVHSKLQIAIRETMETPPDLGTK